MTVDVPIEVDDEVYAIYERIAAEKGETDIDMVIGLDVQGAVAHFFDQVVTSDHAS